MNQKADWSTRKLRLIFGLAGALLMILAVWFLRQSDSPALSESPAPSALEQPPQPTAAEVDPTTGLEPGEEASQEPTGRLPVDWRQPAGQPDSIAVEDIAETLKQADRALAAGQLIEPDDDNALQRYLSVLDVQPDHELAQQGLDAVSAQLLEQATIALDQRMLDQALRVLPALNQISSDDPQHLALADRLKHLQQADGLAEKVLLNLDAGRLVQPPARSAVGRVTELTEFDPDHPELARLYTVVEQALVERALLDANQLSFDQAGQWLSRAEALRGGSMLVSDGQGEVESLRQEALQQRELTTMTAIRSYNFDAAATLVDELRGLGASADQLARVGERLRMGRVYGNHRPGDVISDALTDSVSAPPLVVIPHGQFTMGSSGEEKDHAASEEPQFQVNFALGFALGKTEVTVAEFARFVNATSYLTDAEKAGYSHRYHEKTARLSRSNKINWRDNFEGRKAADNDPVTHVSWRDAKTYAAWLSEQTGQPYRLPSEAEFEYALRGGSETRYWWGDGVPDEVIENLTGSRDRSRRSNQWNSAFAGYGDNYWGPAPVASFLPNPFALYDMAGNVAEWVEDCWHDSYVRAPTDGSAWVNRGCERRVVRGGYWGGSPSKNRSAYRAGYPVGQRGGAIGFRVARDLFPAGDELLSQE